VCIALNEYPYIRYYMPSHHLPLGALKPHEQTRAPPPPETSTRWRTNLARGDVARAHEIADTEFISRLLAFRVQQILDEYKKANPDFPVCFFPRTWACNLVYALERKFLCFFFFIESRIEPTSRHIVDYGPSHGYDRSVCARVYVSGYGE
jgi:hypothetical protein